MERDLVWLDPTTESNVREVGGKAAPLIQLLGRGFRVPPGFCITTDVYRRVLLESNRLSGVLRRVRKWDPHSSVELEQIAQLARETVMQTALDRELEDRILSAYDALVGRAGGTTRVIVRSSATAEDLPEASFAGQYESVPDVVADGLLEAVRRCWASVWTAKAISYRNHRGFDDTAVLAALIVQAMVESESSGVLFTENPASGRPDQLLIAAAAAAGQHVVLGTGTPHEFVVSKATGAIDSRNAAPTAASSPEGASNQGRSSLAERETPLSDSQVRELAALGQSLQEVFGAPQDIEWAIRGGRIYVLQSRPLTSVQGRRQELVAGQKRVLSASAPGTVWSDMMISEVVSFPKPLSRELLERFMSAEGSFGIFYARDLRFGSPFADPILTFICGRPFLNRTALVRPYAFLGFPLKPFDYEAVKLNAGEANTPYPIVDFGPIGSRIVAFGCRALVLLPYAVYRLAATLLRVKKWAATFHGEYYDAILPAFLSRVEKLRGTRLEALGDRELGSAVEGLLQSISRESTMSHIKSEFLAEIAHFVVSLLVGERADGLILGLDGDKHLETNLELWKLARGAASDVAASLQGGRGLPPALTGGAESESFLRRLEAFLGCYGHRAHNEFELADPRWREDPGVLFEIMRAYLRAPEIDPVGHLERQKRTRHELEQEIRDSLSSSPIDRLFGVRRRVFLWARDVLQRYLPLRETSKFYYLMEVEQLRRFALELGDRLSGADYLCLNNRYDVFFLYSDELARTVAKAISPREVKDIVARRKAEYRLQKTIPVPSVVFRDCLDVIGTERVPETSDVLHGTGVSPGRVTGVAKVVMHPAEIGALEVGDVLVAPTTDPGWTPALLVVKGLVMNTGNSLSHGAILAREYGLPTVVNVPEATERIGSGRRITVDGTEGRVYLH